MMQLVMGVLVNLLKGYLVNLASKEFIDFVIFEAAEAAAKSTNSPVDDRAVAIIKAAVHGEKLPE